MALHRRARRADTAPGVALLSPSVDPSDEIALQRKIMADLFSVDEPEKAPPGRPLADRLRPKNLGEVVGQEHLTGAGRRADAA